MNLHHLENLMYKRNELLLELTAGNNINIVSEKH
jgi:hypothetical protein